MCYVTGERKEVTTKISLDPTQFLPFLDIHYCQPYQIKWLNILKKYMHVFY